MNETTQAIVEVKREVQLAEWQRQIQELARLGCSSATYQYDPLCGRYALPMPFEVLEEIFPAI